MPSWFVLLENPDKIHPGADCAGKGIKMLGSRILRCLTALLLLIILAIAVSTETPKTQDKSVVMPSISADALIQLIETENEPLPDYQKIRCGQDVVIEQTLVEDINQDNVQELIVNARCAEIGLANGFNMYVLILSMKSDKTWEIKSFHNYDAFNSEVSLQDLENDGQEELRIRANSGIGGGSGGHAQGIKDIYIKCDQSNCQKSIEFFRFYSGWFRNHSIDNIRGTFPSANELMSSEIIFVGNGKIVQKTYVIEWKDKFILFGGPANTVYELQGLEYQRSYTSVESESYWLDTRSSYKEWQNKFSEFPFDTGSIYPHINSRFFKGFSGVFMDAETQDLIQRERVFYLGALDNQSMSGITDLVVAQGENQSCKISIYYYDTYGELRESSSVENCIPEISTVSIQPLNPEQGRDFIVFSTISTAYGRTPPYQLVSIYKWDPSGFENEGTLVLVDQLVGRLFIAEQDGVTISCDGVGPCQAKVRTWDFDNYQTTLSLPHFEYYTWDSEREKFIPAQH
jgi:hypothetical protein